MKRFLPLLVVVFFAGAAAFAITQWLRHAYCPDETTWLKNEFALSSDQLAAIKKIQAEYEPLCASRCHKITTARHKLEAAKKSPGPDSEAYRSASVEFAAISQECADASRRQIEAIAAQMSPEQGRRYLALVGPKLSDASRPLHRHP